jgi:hypothetical protein
LIENDPPPPFEDATTEGGATGGGTTGGGTALTAVLLVAELFEVIKSVVVLVTVAVDV